MLRHLQSWAFQQACLCGSLSLVATESKVMQINTSNLLVVREATNKPSLHVLQENTAYCNVFGEP